MKVYRKVRQTKFVKDGLSGLLSIHDSGRIAVSIDHKPLFVGLKYEKTDSYFFIGNPSATEKL